MTIEYTKLTVVKLREELVSRGLPKTGLKPVLVSRLIESDAQRREDESTINPQTTALPVTQSDGIAVVLEAQDQEDTGRVINGLDHNELQSPEPVQSIVVAEDGNPAPIDSNQLSQEIENTPIALKDPVQQEPSIGIGALSTKFDIEVQERNILVSEVSENLTSAGIVKVSAPQETLEMEHPNQPRTEEPPLVTNSVFAEAAQAKTIAKEFLEDSKKRKRKSQSPPVSSVETAQKRAKIKDMNDSRPDVKLPEDVDMKALQDGVAENFEKPDDERVGQPEDTSMTDVSQHQLLEDIESTTISLMHGDTGPSAVNIIDHVSDPVPPVHYVSKDSKLPHSDIIISDSITTNLVESMDDNTVIHEVPPGHQVSEALKVTQIDTTELSLQPPKEELPAKHSPSDTRFKNLFTGSSKCEDSPIQQASYSDLEDRVVSSAIHPATSALYIRDFMRPLKPENLKEHLIALATPSNITPDAQIVTEFFLDAVRTHCLVAFVNTSAASRVRSSLHSRVWPDERTRRPLWVDFVPEEKIKKWIEVEQAAPSSRGQSAKRWEVVYEDEEDGIKAYLQEAGSNSTAPRPIQPHSLRAEVGQGVLGAPLGPRIREVERRPPHSGDASKADHGKGFQALDDLFKSTAAKPKLYYLPVDKLRVDKRLDKLDASRGGGKGGEMRKYTFEEEVLVDRGPEYSSRGRGGSGGRGGGHSGGYSRRGGGYRGDTWRDRR